MCGRNQDLGLEILQKSKKNTNEEHARTPLVPKVIVIILNWNGRNVLGKCLDSVLRTDYQNFEVVVVDNASNDGSQSVIKYGYPGLTVFENSRNLGYAEGNNVGIRCTKSDYVVLLNNDTIVHKDWISELIKVALIDDRIGILGCKVYLMGTKIIQHAGSELSYLSNSLFGRSFTEDRGQFDDITDVDYISGEAMMIRREAFERVGLLDPQYFGYWEDVDFCYRARKCGYRITYVPKSTIEHVVSASWDKRPLEAKMLSERNRLLFVLKNLPYHIVAALPILELIHISRCTMEGLAKTLATRDPNTRAAILGLPKKASSSAQFRVILEWATALLYAYSWNIRFLRKTLSSRAKSTAKII